MRNHLKPVRMRELRAEWIKARGSFAVWLTVAGTLANMLIFFLLYAFSADQAMAGNPWLAYILQHYDGIAFMMLPLFVIILCSLVTFMEYRQGMWIALFTLPNARSRLYLGKLAFTLLLFVAAHLAFVAGMLLTGVFLGLAVPASGLLQHAPPLGIVLRLAFETVWSILGLLGLHFWLSWRFGHFIVPLTLGIVGFVGVSIQGPGWWGNAFIPYAYPIQYMPWFKGEVSLAIFQGVPLYYWLSPLYGILFTVMGIWEVRRQQVKPS